MDASIFSGNGWRFRVHGHRYIPRDHREGAYVPEAMNLSVL